MGHKERNLDRLVSCRITNSIIRYLEAQGFETASLFQGISYTREYLLDPDNWVNIETREILAERAAVLANNKKIMFLIGMETKSLSPMPGFAQIIRTFGSPRIAYGNVPRHASYFDRSIRFKVEMISNNSALIAMYPDLRILASPHACYYAQGVLAAVPCLWNLPPAEIRELNCVCPSSEKQNESGIQYESNNCLYKVSWQSPQFNISFKVKNFIFSRSQVVEDPLKVLESNQMLLENRNEELLTRNIQINKVREMALSIVNMRTTDEVYQSVVEISRDIPGVHFVIILQGDESGKYVTAPYYSKIRNQAIVTALKVIGYDLNAVLGEKPDSKTFSFPISKSKMVQDFIKNPRAMVNNSLAEMMEGIWPRPLCDAIQKTAGICSIITIPIVIERQPWGGILYYLNKEVPMDILEMIGSHCSAAIKNTLVIEKLEILYEHEKKQRQELEEEVKARAQLIHVLAHEMRTPLTPIIVSVEMLQEMLSNNPDSVLYKLINNTARGVQSLKNRLEELLDLARYSRGVFKLNIQTINAGEFIERTGSVYRSALESKGQQLTIRLSPGLPQIDADLPKLEQVLLNLLSNASKYSPDNTEIELNAGVENQYLLVEIKDRGIGITPEETAQLFQPYHRVQQDRQSFPGIGLGLAVSKQIVEAHKGRIWVESESGKGSSFKFTVPLRSNISRSYEDP